MFTTNFHSFFMFSAFLNKSVYGRWVYYIYKTVVPWSYDGSSAVAEGGLGHGVAGGEPRGALPVKHLAVERAGHRVGGG